MITLLITVVVVLVVFLLVMLFELKRRQLWLRGINRDLTARKEAEETLKKSEEKMRLLLNSTAEGIYGIDLQGNCTYVNPSCLRMLGYADMDQLLGKNIHQLIHHSHSGGSPMPVEECSIYRAFREGRGMHRDDEVFWRADGTLFPVEYYSYPQIVNGEVSGAAVTFINITKRRQAEDALRESQKRFQGLVETLYDWVWEVDTQGRYTYVSPQIKSILGYDPQEILGKTPYDLMSPEEAKGVSEIFDALIKERKPLVALENISIHKDGHLVVLETNGLPFYDADGNLKGYRGTDRDITVRKQVESALIESEKKFRVMTDTSPLAIYMSSGIEQKAEYINPTFTKLFGYTIKEVPSVSQWWPLAYPDEKYRNQIAEEWQRKVEHAIKTKSEIEPMEVIVTCKDGAKKYISWGYISTGEQNWAFGLDLTERIQAEEALKETSEYLNNLIEYANAPIIVWDTEFGITRFNRAFEHITGMSAKDVIGKHIELLFPEETKMQSLEHIRKTVSGEKWETVEIPIRHIDGTIRALLWNSANIYSAQGKTLVSTIAQGLDITERKQVEEKIRHMATHDGLTDLPTLRLAKDRLSMSLGMARRYKKMVAVMFIDLDGFKAVNDTLGHDAGDYVLKQVAKRLVSGMRATNTVARVGGDEFLLIATELHSPDNAALIAEKVLRLVSQPILFDGQHTAVGASIGIALFPHDGDDIDRLIKLADEAMYRIKNSGKNGYGFANTAK